MNLNKWKDYRIQQLTEGEDDKTLTGLSAGMLGAAQNLVPTLTNFTKYIGIIMNPNDNKRSSGENEIRIETVRNALGDLKENAKLLVKNYKFIVKYIDETYDFKVEDEVKEMVELEEFYSKHNKLRK
jgi:hypothetical protein